MADQLDERTAPRDPLEQFRRWFAEAQASEPKHPEAMNLVTATPDGKPSSRIVLLKQLDARGFVFFTNYHSRKALELDENASAGLTFYWPSRDRQVRIEGTISRTDRRESEEYFATRPRGSQLGAQASDQSQPLASRDELEKTVARLEQLYDGKPIPCPPHWGGFVLAPSRIEFWQGRENRLHDRIVYERQDGDNWSITRLAP